MDKDKGSIIHEPLVPRTFRLLAELEKEGDGIILLQIGMEVYLQIMVFYMN